MNSLVRESELESELKNNIEGEVRFDNATRALYSTDGSNYRQVPIGVVLPKTKDDVIKTVSLCRKYKAPILSRGGGTSLAGQCCNTAIVMDMSKYYNAILELNPTEKYARIQPGLVLDELRNAAEKHHLTFGPDPSTHNHCTLGGMIGNNSCGTHSVMAGETSANVYELEILLYDGTQMTVGATTDNELKKIIEMGGRQGEIYKKLLSLRDRYENLIRSRFPKIPRRVSGYDLTALLPENNFNIAKAITGSEGTLITILEAKVRLVDSPPSKTLLVLGYPDVFSAGDHVPEILQYHPIALEGMDDLLADFIKEKHLHQKYLKLLPEGRGWLICEFGGQNKEEADAKAQGVMEQLKNKKDAPTMQLYDNKDEEKMVWKIRESGLGATARVPSMPDTWEGWEDSAVHPNKLGKYLRELRELFVKYNYLRVALYGHFGQGCVHCRVPFDLKTVDGIKKYRQFLDEAADLVLKHGGSISGEHGDGQSKAELLPKMFGPELITAFEEFKMIWDPDCKMNPGKIVKPHKITENLRLGANFSPLQLNTHFKFPEDDYDFARTTTRCVGVGDCRRHEGGTMCPSYMVTREEMHSTRGRAHLLFEMILNDQITDQWQSKEVHEALDLCLACKGCKSDCPMNVDMATYKSEFLSHYFNNRLRPRHAYAFGLINYWANIASYTPNFINLFSQAPVINIFAKFLANMSQARSIPKFAPRTFKSWFANKKTTKANDQAVILWADTFNNHFHPETAKAAVEVLEIAGFNVIVPSQNLCCGRPLYDYGMLNLAKKYLQHILKTLRPAIRSGTPIVVLEPSCYAVFRDELINLFPQDEDANRLSKQTYLFSEFLQEKAPHFELPELNVNALLQLHCHHKSISKTDHEGEVLKKMKVKYNVPELGCCGMAGAFGFENSHYEISQKIGERHLISSVSAAPKEQLIIADGFSCREQISQSTDRHGLHLAQIISLALKHQSNTVWQHYPENLMIEKKKFEPTKTEYLLLVVISLALIYFVYLAAQH